MRRRLRFLTAVAAPALAVGLALALIADLLLRLLAAALNPGD